MKNLVLFFGGKSCEHDISIITAMQLKANLNTKKYQIYPVYIAPSGKWFLVEKLNSPQEFADFNEKSFSQVFLPSGQKCLQKKGRFGLKNVCEIDVALIACHGPEGEDGCLQGVLKMAGVPFSSSGVATSAVCMDKVFCKQIFEVNNMPVTKYIWFSKRDYVSSQQKVLKQIKTEIDFPCVVKPANLGSSIGIGMAKNMTELEEAISVALCYDNKILVEEAVSHLKELNMAAYYDGEKVVLSRVFEPVTWQKFFGFDQKYLSKNPKTVLPPSAKLPAFLKAQIKAITRECYKVFDCKGVIRLDFLLDEDTEELFVSEINSIPGSFSHFMFENLSFSDLLDAVIQGAEHAFKEEKALKCSYESTVLTGASFAKK